MPKAVWMLLLVLVVNIIFLIGLYKEVKISTFDSAFAISIGIPVVFLHYLFMTVVSVTTVAAFDSVGAILVVAMLIGPAATAYLISKTIKQMMILSMLYGAGAAFFGYYSAKLLDTSISGMMATAVGLFFVATLLVQRIIQRKSVVKI